MLMERVAEVVRGWPYDGSLDRVEPIKTSVTLVNGDWVAKEAGNVIDKTGATPTSSAGLVIVGNGDSSSASTSGKAVVLWGNFIAKVSNFTAGVYAPGDKLTVVSGKLTKATAADLNDVTAPLVLGDPVIGYVLDVVAASATETAHIVVKVA